VNLADARHATKPILGMRVRVSVVRVVSVPVGEEFDRLGVALEEFLRNCGPCLFRMTLGARFDDDMTIQVREGDILELFRNEKTRENIIPTEVAKYLAHHFVEPEHDGPSGRVQNGGRKTIREFEVW
jgi:hypothetical protein